MFLRLDKSARPINGERQPPSSVRRKRSRLRPAATTGLKSARPFRRELARRQLGAHGSQRVSGKRKSRANLMRTLPAKTRQSLSPFRSQKFHHCENFYLWRRTLANQELHNSSVLKGLCEIVETELHLQVTDLLQDAGKSN